MGYYITVTISTAGLYAVQPVAWSNIGIVGKGVGAGFTVDTAYTIKSPKDAEIFGTDSALYKSILLLFSNGANNIIAVAADITAAAASPEAFDGDDSTTEFTLTDIPSQPLEEVAIDAAPLTEDVDFYVDYGNKKVIFYTAPATGSGNITVTYTEHLTAQMQSALAVLTTLNVQVIVAAMTFDITLLGDVKSHVDSVASTNPCIAIFMQTNGEVAVTKAATLESEMSVLIAHKSLKDVAAAVAGVIASLRPWIDLTMKSVGDIQQTEEFTSSQFAVFDAAKLIVMHDPPKLTGTARVISKGFTLDAGTELQFIDQVRTVQYVAAVLENGLTNPNVIGTMRMNRSGLRQLQSYIRSLLNPLVNAGTIDSYNIDNPALRLFETQNPDAEDITNMTALQVSRSLSGNYAIAIELVYSGTIQYIAVDASLVGGA